LIFSSFGEVGIDDSQGCFVNLKSSYIMFTSDDDTTYLTKSSFELLYLCL